MIDEKYVLYVGNCIGEPGTAMAVHVSNRTELLSRLGYKIIIICNGNKKEEIRKNVNGTECCYAKRHFTIPVIRSLENRIECIWGNNLFYLFEKKTNEVFPAAVFFYGYAGQNKIMKLCREKNIPLFVDRVDWFEKNDRRGFFAKYIIQNQVDYSIKKMDFNAGGIVAISDFLFEHYKNAGCKCINVPPIFNTIDMAQYYSFQCDNILKLAYAGSLGDSKDIIQPIIQVAIDINNGCGNKPICFDIVGISEDEYIRKYGSLNYVASNIHFHGRQNHETTMQIIGKADFSILLRNNRQYAKAGYSTKFVESMCLGVPVICTRVGGCDNSIIDGQNGFLVQNNTYDELYLLIQKLMNLSAEEKKALKVRTADFAKEKYDIGAYQSVMQEFIGDEVK